MKTTKKKDYSDIRYRTEAVFGIFFGFMFIVLLNVFWRSIPFLKPEFGEILPLINISSVFSISISALLFIFPVFLVKYLHEATSYLFTLLIGLFFIIRFPFDFSTMGGLSVFDRLLPFVLVLILVLGGIGLAVRTVKLFVRLMEE